MKKILIADDDVAINRLFQFYLKKKFSGEILSAFNGRQAEEICLRLLPDLVFLDIMMPEKDGLTALRELRAAGFDKPVIVVTAFYEANLDTCYQAGANYVLRKPAGMELILNQLRYMNGQA
jgi:CheY-like chemotaxis protein